MIHHNSQVHSSPHEAHLENQYIHAYWQQTHLKKMTFLSVKMPITYDTIKSPLVISSCHMVLITLIIAALETTLRCCGNYYWSNHNKMEVIKYQSWPTKSHLKNKCLLDSLSLWHKLQMKITLQPLSLKISL